jgi:hypothetical protein
MTFAFTRILDAVLGRGESAITIPALDGALRPNRRLDEASQRIPISDPSGILAGPEGLLVSSGDEVRRLDADGAGALVHKAKSAISCLGRAAGGIAVGLENGAVELVGGRFDGAAFEPTPEAHCPTAIEGTEDGLYVCHGSSSNSPSNWQRDLMERNASGSVWLLDPASGSRHRIIDRLAFPAGIVANRETLIVAEAWRHRLIRLDRATGKFLDLALDDLPGYPGQIARDGGQGYLLSVFAPRSQLVEFILREPGYRRRMLAEVEARYWVAPSFRAGRSFYEPLQGGGVKHLGILKPWAPTLSFGMVVRTDENWLPLDSFQSRADGSTHGITGALLHDGSIYAASRGDDVMVRLEIPAGETPGAS